MPVSSSSAAGTGVVFVPPAVLAKGVARLEPAGFCALCCLTHLAITSAGGTRGGASASVSSMSSTVAPSSKVTSATGRLPAASVIVSVSVSSSTVTSGSIPAASSIVSVLISSTSGRGSELGGMTASPEAGPTGLGSNKSLVSPGRRGTFDDKGSSSWSSPFLK